MTLPDHFKLYDQTTFSAQPGPGAGDCMRASIATVIQADPATLTNWAELGDDWAEIMRTDIRTLGYVWAVIDWDSIVQHQMDAKGNTVILCGPGPRGIPHAVVGTVDNGKPVVLHDPHPERRGLSGDPTQVWVLLPITELEGVV